MSIQHSTRLLRAPIVIAAAAALVLLVLGEIGSAGIQGSGRFAVLAYGRITALGSIFVDGVEYDLSHAQIRVDGHPAKTNQLAVGQIVTVQGDLSGSNTGTATDVTFTGDVVGPISKVDVAGRALTILGQTVTVDAATVFGEGIEPSGSGALRVGTNVEVSAFVTASGDLRASRIDLQPAGAPLQAKGAIEALDPDTQSFQVNRLRIDYSGAVVNGKLANGRTAIVWADEYPSSGTLHATKIKVSMGLGGAAGVMAQLQGLITSFSSESAFFVGDQLVITTADTHFVLHGQSLRPDLTVKVHGAFNSSAALVATQVEAGL